MKASKAKQKGFYITFVKAQTAAAAATVLDFIIYIMLVELLGLWYVASAAISALFGAVCNFLLGRHWCFYATDGHLSKQGMRYIIVSAGSLLLNTAGIFMLTETFAVHYLWSKVIIAVAVAVFYNFPLQRYFVFKTV